MFARRPFKRTLGNGAGRLLPWVPIWLACWCQAPAVEASSGTPADGCVPGEHRLATTATLAGHAGRYRLTLMDGDGQRVQGALTLVAPPAGSPRVLSSATISLHGFTDVNLAAVGAERVGDPDSRAPDAPGVLVLESTRAGVRSILLRLGSTANRQGLLRYDGSYTVLDVLTISADGFAGRWRSGGRQAEVQGDFCAVIGN